ncbi:Phosphorylase superfamily protein [Enhydrobacter aerosaccus]|uniref:Phosphorylase superfamily protein n=1 Tax=Enhydrobacter aerosaccus TaxID=225324 RepID=A0A1T4RXJ5_9HYPH|nr:hypothetical protein [Enhydrobacter aerosaccus]SKA20468.1 Phosphorylase superfamily protein [Enhydrobacter aerosaccus]
MSLSLALGLAWGLARRLQAVICLIVLLSPGAGRADQFKVLDAYTGFAGTPAVNSASDYIAWLRQQPAFRDGKLDHLPDHAVILHNTNVRGMLNGLGYGDAVIEEVPIGYTDPNVLFVVRPARGQPFLVNRGLPGAGGISTQLAELAALGVKQAIHIGTAGLLGSRIPYSSLIIATGAYKDGAAFLLASTPAEAAEQIAFADAGLTDRLDRDMTAAGIAHVRALGFTSPVYYFQKTGLLKTLLTFPFDAGQAPGFVEMEEASFFASARLVDVKAASIVVGSDRAVPTGDTIRQEFFDGSLDPLLSQALRQAIVALSTRE